MELLAPALQQPGAIAVDGTLGLGGHAEALLRAHPGLRLVGVDRDTTALERARQRLAPYADRIDLVHAVYSDIPRILDELGIDRVHGLLFDLGVSSPQLDEAERGFAYSYDAPLDMRMDRTQERTAADIVNTYPASELTRIFRVYGEERFAARIAQAIVRQRAEPVRTTGVLADLVRSAIPRQPAAAEATPRNALSKRCGSKSTPNSPSWNAPFPRHSPVSL